MSGWISVKEKLPKKGKKVITYRENGFIGFSNQLWKYNTHTAEFLEGITYWMPLPEPPKEGEK